MLTGDRRAGDTVRINAQLIDATTGGHIWADRFDGPVENIFDIQDKFVRKIVDAMAVNLLPEDAAQIGQGQTNEIAAREAFQKGWELYLRFTPEDNLKAVEHVEAAVELDPEYGRAYALLALIYLNIDNWSWYRSLGLGISWVSYQTYLEKEETYLELAKRYPTALAHVAASKYSISNRDDHASALNEAREALALDPNEPEAHIAMAWALITTNEPAIGLKFIETAFRLNPRPPAHYFLTHGFAYFALGDLDKAAEIFKAGIDLYPKALELAPPLASTYALLGRREKARQALLRWEAVETQLQIEALPDKYFFPYRWVSDDRKIYDRFWDGFYAATLPPETTVSDLIETVQHGDVFERLLAIKSLGRLGEIAAEAVPNLITSLGDDELSVQKETAIALGKIGPAAEEAIPALEALQDRLIVGLYAKEALKSIRAE